MRLFFIAAILSFLAPHADAQGIVFQNGNFDDIRAQAAQTDKLVFIDFYTDWCAPCKKMAAEVFPDNTLGSFYNERFISWKINAEKGEGIALAKKYGVTAFPTLIWIDAEGELISKALGFKTIPRLLEQGEAAIRELHNPNALRFMQAGYEKKKNDTAFLRQFIESLNAQRMPYTTALQQYKNIAAQQPLMNQSTVALLNAFDKEVDLDDPYFAKIEKSLQVYQQQNNSVMVNGLTSLRDKVGLNTLRKAMSSGDESQLDRFLAFYTPKADKMFDEPKDYKLEFYLRTKNWPAFRENAKKFLDSIYATITVEGMKIKDEAHYKSVLEKSRTNGHNLNPKALERALESSKTGYSVNIGKRVIMYAIPYANQFSDSDSRRSVEKWLGKLIEINPGNTDFLVAYANGLYLNNKPAAAIEMMQKALDLSAESSYSREVIQKKMDLLKSGKPLGE